VTSQSRSTASVTTPLEEWVSGDEGNDVVDRTRLIGLLRRA
jgi:hypothetical protein